MVYFMKLRSIQLSEWGKS